MSVNELLTQPDTGPNGHIERDRYGRYLLPHPETGKKQPWTRVTTLSSTLADRFGLEKWNERNIVWGLGQRQDLYARAAAARLDDKDILTRVVEDAKAAAADAAGRNFGSAIHQFTERIDRGEQVTVPPPYDRDIAAYRAALDAADIAVVMGWVEKIVIVPELGVAGTLDRIVDGPWPKPRIADVKTGKDVVNFGMTEIALQLALYAHASWMWDGHGWHPMDPVDQDKGIVMHLPVGQGTCTLYEVDIAAGWDAVQLAVDVRAWRKRKNLASQIPAVGTPEATPADGNVAGPPNALATPAGPATTTTMSTARHAWAAARVDRIKDAGDLPRRRLANLWSEHPEIPTFKRDGPRTNDEIQTVVDMCDQVEAEFELPFGPSDPTAEPATKATITKRGQTDG